MKLNIFYTVRWLDCKGYMKKMQILMNEKRVHVHGWCTCKHAHTHRLIVHRMHFTLVPNAKWWAGRVFASSVWQKETKLSTLKSRRPCCFFSLNLTIIKIVSYNYWNHCWLMHKRLQSELIITQNWTFSIKSLFLAGVHTENKLCTTHMNVRIT